MTTPTGDGVSVVLPVRNAAATVATAVSGWVGYLKTCGRGWELIVVDDGSTDGTATLATESGARVVRHESLKGFGASLRTAHELTTHPLVAYASFDYPYTPSDLGKLLERIDTPSEIPDPTTGEYVMRLPDIVSGRRMGVPVPPLPKVLGGIYRTFCKLAFGLPLQPLPSWYGFGEHLRAWRAWFVYGNPLHDPNSAFKLFRRSFLDRFPIQSDGEFVHVELVAKATFLTCLIDELPLTPHTTPIPRAAWDRADRNRLLRNPKFWKPPFTVPSLATSVP